MRGLLIVPSMVVFTLAKIIGFLYSLRYLFTKPRQWFLDLNEKLYRSAISEDQYGNIWLKEILNDLCVKAGGHHYGDEDDTVSDITGRNERDGTLTTTGKWFTRALSAVLGKNHAIQSIDE